MVKTPAQGAQVQSLVRELKSHRSHCAAKKKKKTISKEPPALVGCCRFRGAPGEKADALMPGLWEEFLVFDDGFHS